MSLDGTELKLIKSKDNSWPKLEMCLQTFKIACGKCNIIMVYCKLSRKILVITRKRQV